MPATVSLVNSGRFDGKSVTDGKRAIVESLAQRGVGEAKVNYRLHDWCVSRQRYWGPPIPIIYCETHAARCRCRKRTCR